MNLREIAKQAGVSLTTVSLVLNGKPGISSETRERVKDLLRQNGYDVEGKSKSNRSICFLKYLRHAHLVNGNPRLCDPDHGRRGAGMPQGRVRPSGGDNRRLAVQRRPEGIDRKTRHKGRHFPRYRVDSQRYSPLPHPGKAAAGGGQLSVLPSGQQRDHG